MGSGGRDFSRRLYSFTRQCTDDEQFPFLECSSTFLPLILPFFVHRVGSLSLICFYCPRQLYQPHFSPLCHSFLQYILRNNGTVHITILFSSSSGSHLTCTYNNHIFANEGKKKEAIDTDNRVVSGISRILAQSRPFLL